MSSPPLWGLVLAGGRASRMGRDKGALSYHGRPQVRHCLDLLGAVCAQSFVSVRPDQTGTAPYAGLPAIVDRGDAGGPAAGLLAAFAEAPQAAWLVLAADMPLVGAELLGQLAAGRDASRLATAFRHPDGTPEPLCTIFEPAAGPRLAARVAAKDASLRRLLEASPVCYLTPADAGALRSVDRRADYEALQKALARRRSAD